MRHRKILQPFILFVAVLFGATACASGGADTADGMPAPAGDAVTVQVNNNLVNPSVVTVTLVNEDGTQQLLGTVSPNGVETFTYNGPLMAGDYRLVAERTDGSEVMSRRIPNLNRGVALDWDLSLNSVTVR